MENCLVTKLKSTVSNDNLEKLNVLSFTVPTRESFYSGEYLELSLAHDVVISTKDSYFVDEQNNKIDSPITVSASVPMDQRRVRFPITGGSYELKTKYDLTLWKDYRHIDINVKKLSSCKDISYLSGFSGDLSYLKDLILITNLTAGANVIGNISSLLNHTAITYLSLANNANVIGDIVNLGKMIRLKNLYIGNTGIYGTIESFVQAQRAARVAAGLDPANSVGIETSNLFTLENLTFGGVIIPSIFNNGTLTWTSNQITITQGANSKTVDA